MDKIITHILRAIMQVFYRRPAASACRSRGGRLLAIRLRKVAESKMAALRFDGRVALITGAGGGMLRMHVQITVRI